MGDIMKKYIFFIVLGTLLIFVLGGCRGGVAVKDTEQQTQVKNGNKLSMEEISKNCPQGYSIKNIFNYGSNYILIQYSVTAASDQFEFVNLETGDKDFLPKGVDYAEFVSIENENWIILLDQGTNSESNRRIFPFLINCERQSENVNKQDDFNSIIEKIDFKLDEKINIGVDRPEVLDKIITDDKILEIQFGPVKGNEIGFFSDFISPPWTSFEYDKKDNSLIISMKDTTIAETVVQSLKEIKNENIKSVDYKINNNSLKLIIFLSDGVKSYSGECAERDMNIPCIMLEFKK
jgi:hypothetical protein